MTEPVGVADLALVGEGEMPVEFQRVNWGAFFVGPFWAAFYGLRWVVIGYATVFVGYLGIANGVLWSAPESFAPVQSVLDAVFFPLIAVAGIVLGLMTNRYLWRVQAERLQVPGARPIPVWRLRKSHRFWFAVATVLAALSLLSTVTTLVAQPSDLTSSIGAVFGAVSFPGLYAYDLYLRGRSRNAG